MVDNTVVKSKPGGIPNIPVDWATLGLKSGYRPKDVSGLRMWIVGPEGEGKSTFLASIPNTLILDFELGADSIVGKRATDIGVRNYDHYMQVTQKLIDDAKKGRWIAKRIGYDTVDEWCGMIVTQLQKEKGVDDITEFGSSGHGWAMIRNRCWSRVRELEDAGYTWACVGHMTDKQVTNPVTHKEITVVRPVIFKSFGAVIKRNADFYATIYNITADEPNVQMVTVPGKKEKVAVTKGYTTKKRYYFDCRSIDGREGKERGVPEMKLKFEIPRIGGWDTFAKEYNEAVDKSKQEGVSV